ncbi:uncharacterized protein [Arachis hypogaea]|uniref:uncharacterized protein n=1 Tax=Arachis hypogaea TaxID=3818 RepID=UPI003B218893
MVFVMAHMRRWKKESTIFKKAKKLFVVDVLHICAPSDGAMIGVLVYRFVPKGHWITDLIYRRFRINIPPIKKSVDSFKQYSENWTGLVGLIVSRLRGETKRASPSPSLFLRAEHALPQPGKNPSRHHRRREEPCLPPSVAVRHPEFRYKTEFQSHEPEFDDLKSLEIEEKINKIKWCQTANGALFLLSTNDKTIKFWKQCSLSIRPLALITVLSLSPNADIIPSFIHTTQKIMPSEIVAADLFLR